VAGIALVFWPEFRHLQAGDGAFLGSARAGHIAVVIAGNPVVLRLR